MDGGANFIPSLMNGSSLGNGHSHPFAKETKAHAKGKNCIEISHHVVH